MRILLAATLGDTLRAFYLPLAHNLRSRGWQVDGMARDISICPKCCSTFDHVWEVPLSRNPLDIRDLLAARREIAAIVSRNRYDLVHVSTPIAAFVTRLALRRLRRQGGPKVIYTAHGFHFHKRASWLQNALFLTAERLAGRWTDCLTVMNAEDRHVAERYNLVPEGRLVYIPGVGIDRAQFSRQAVPDSAVAEIGRELRLDREQPVILMIAEFNANKRHRDALRAFSRIRSQSAHLVLAGDGVLFEPMQRLAADLGIAHRVRFLGSRRDIPRLLCAATVLVLPSGREGLPRSVMEALCFGVPVIGSDIRGTRDLLADGCGLLFNVGDVDALTRAMDWILEHPAEAHAMGQRGRQQMEKYDISSIIRLHEEIYLNALQEGVPA